MWYEGCYWEGDVISFCSLDVFIQRALLWWFFFFLWRSYWSSLQNSRTVSLPDSQLAVSGCVLAASISSLLWWSTLAVFLWSYTVCYWTFYVATGSQSPFSAVFYENCLVFSGHPLTHPKFRSCTTTLFTSASYCRILVVSFVFQFFFQIMSFFARAIVASSFLLWISSRLPSFDPSFITFLQFRSSYLDPLFKVVYLVFSSFTNRFLLFIISFAFS